MSVGCFLAAAEASAPVQGQKLTWTLLPDRTWDSARPAEVPVAALSKTPYPQAQAQFKEKVDALSSATAKYRVAALVFSQKFFDSQETHYFGEEIR